ncbi:DUF4870 domain-containing protein [Aquibacillus saliphilus]|uniref:DUF4870 domain-containing protein n=1 Tax=Aquibacillus saliphilus TaxID=1909422 RepID=UPI0034E23252
MTENVNEENNQEKKEEEKVEPEVTEEMKDAEDNKAMGILAYLIFFIPLLAAKESKFAMYHANQGLTLFLLFVAVNVVGTIIPLLGWLLIIPLGNLLVFVLAIIGIINAAKGEVKQLPMIGKIQLIKSMS